MAEQEETLEGYVVDLACIRHYPQAVLYDRSHVHTRDCALMGHCIESGYGLVDDQGIVSVLDTTATPLVVGALRDSKKNKGIYLRARREMQNEEMRTVSVEEVEHQA